MNKVHRWEEDGKMIVDVCSLCLLVMRVQILS